MIRKKTLRKLPALLLAGLVLSLASCTGKTLSGPSSSGGAVPGTTAVEIAYLNHPPVLPILTHVEKVLAAYSGKVIFSRYDFDTPEGAVFAKKKNLTGHTPLVIFINGASTVELAGRRVTFESFPKGEGPGMVPDGGWSMADLDAALKAATAK